MSATLVANAEKLKARFSLAEEEMQKVIVGQEKLLNRLLIALLTDGHLLLEGLPGVAKTLAVTTLAEVVQCDHKRVQFTPDLLPADLIGTSVWLPKEGAFSIRKGPIFTQILLADEINRAPPKVQSALLEVMQERQITISGETFKTGRPYLVLATQNPIEHEGTYPLPEAQTDRFFMKVKIPTPTMKEEKIILDRMAHLENIPQAKPILTPEEILEARKYVDQIRLDEKVQNYLLQIVFATRDPKEFNIPIEGLLAFGASPRASIALTLAGKAKAFLEGRQFVTPDDIKAIAHDVLRHRLRRTFEAEAEEVTPDDIIDTILSHLTVP